MILAYTDGDGLQHKIKTSITTNHPVSSYGWPVIVLASGNVLDIHSWCLLRYRIIKISKKEQILMEKWLGVLDVLLG